MLQQLSLNICTQKNGKFAAGTVDQQACQIYLFSFILVESSAHSVRRRQLDETVRFLLSDDLEILTTLVISRT